MLRAWGRLYRMVRYPASSAAMIGDPSMTQAHRYILAPYVPTPPDVADQMIALAAVDASDFVVDLGCGDGRIAIAAARVRRAHALGVDIEPSWIEEARTNAEAAGVSHLTEFLHQDALSVDLRPATVVFIYLVEWSTNLVAERILGQCRSGTRVVSHSFAFPASTNAATETFVDANGRRRFLHLWVLP